jgi:hypothetical protein
MTLIITVALTAANLLIYYDLFKDAANNSDYTPSIVVLIIKE